MMNTIERTLTSANDAVTDRLDSLEQSLPGIPAKAVAATRASVRRVNHAVGAAASSMWSRADDVGEVAGAAVATTSGQARSNATKASEAVRRGAAETTGQARAQTRRTVEAVADKVEGALDDATVAAVPSDLSQWSKSDLYERAQALDIDGRSSMSKAELIRAIQRS